VNYVSDSDDAVSGLMNEAPSRGRVTDTTNAEIDFVPLGYTLQTHNPRINDGSRAHIARDVTGSFPLTIGAASYDKYSQVDA
jgi:hypothetical protein